MKLTEYLIIDGSIDVERLDVKRPAQLEARLHHGEQRCKSLRRKLVAAGKRIRQGVADTEERHARLAQLNYERFVRRIAAEVE